MFEDITVEGIKSEILARIETDLLTAEGSFANDAVSAVAVELYNLYHSLDALLPVFYLDETSGEYIDKQAALFGLTRKTGTRATCSITFSGTNGATVPAGTPFYTQSGLTYTLSADITIAGGTASGSLTAESVGVAYNISSGEITSTLKNYSGISGYTNGAASGGTDAETDTALLARLQAQLRRAPTSGNPYHYQSWAESVDGVGAVRVISKWSGPGTVKVLLASQAMEPVASDVVTAAAAYIETQRPVGPAVTVLSASGHELAVAATVSIDGTTTKAKVQTAFETAVWEYLKSLVSENFTSAIDLDFDTLESKTYTVLYNRIAFLLLSVPGVVDYSSLTVAGGTANLTIAADEVPKLTGVTVS